MYYWHALPEGWETMPYQAFLKKRRELMAVLIRDAYKKLVGKFDVEADKAPLMSVETLIKEKEGNNIEFKSTLRVNLHLKNETRRLNWRFLRRLRPS